VISKIDWIRSKLSKHDRYEVLEMYDQFKEETESNASFETFRKSISKEYNALNNIEVTENESFDVKESFINVFEDFIEKNKKKISYSDIPQIAKEYVLNEDTVKSMLSDSEVIKILDVIYKVNALHIETKVEKNTLLDQIKILKAENNYLMKNQVEIEKIMSILDQAVTEYEPFDKPNIILENNKKKKTALLMISDIHIGEIVKKEDTLGLNEYSTEIAKKRIDTLFKKCIDNCKELNVSDIVVALGGDLISGIIHEEILRNSDDSLTKIIIGLADYLAQHIRELTKYFNSIKVYSVVGNHGRVLAGKPYYANYSELNFETLILNFMQRELKNVVEEFVLPEGLFTIFNVMGKTICLTHGHIFKGGNGFQVVPNTVSRDSAKLVGMIEMTSKRVDYFIIGHFHNPGIGQSFIGNIPVYINGTIMGANAYTISNYKNAIPPSQTLLIMEENIGVKYYNEIRV